GVAGLAGASGPIIGGAIAQGLNWHWIFWVNVPIGLAATILSIGRLRESRGSATRIDVPGLVLVSVLAVSVMYAMAHATETSGSTLQVVGAACVGVVSLVGLLWWERRAPEPMLPLGLFRNAAFTLANAISFAQFAALSGSAFLVVQYLQNVAAYS